MIIAAQSGDCEFARSPRASGTRRPQTAWLFCVRGTTSSNPAPSSREPLVPLENALELADVVPKDCLACTALYRNGGGSNSQRNLLKPKIVISHLGGSDHRSEGRNEETRNGRGCGRKTSSSATVSCIFGFPRMSHWKRGRRCVAAERIPGVRGVTEHDVIEFQPRRPSPRVRNGREAPRLQTFQAPPERGGSTVRSRPRPHAS
jgi:hypothetical protein